ncbi:MAG: tRNA (adenosine(37)-N6)-threonylcarbamoyltransferase complex dimerization subunit type 1 TsaB [Deltaproteobacteria bacterium]|nr:tRNA (adenosine(37)-N6)-threonylcarbamoyltransferase complex dimerization subunit type 1 TsaB [Deltaproteobacteria bacterium]
MRLLTIDTASRLGTVATIDGDQILCELVSPHQTRHAECLLDLVGQVLEQAAWKLADLELIAVGMGPGSFTGVRVGMATAKGLALSTGLPVVGVVSLEAMAHAVRALRGPVRVAALLDAKKAEVFGAAYGADGAGIAPPATFPRESVTAWLSGLDTDGDAPMVICGEIAAELSLARERVVSHRTCDLPSPGAIASLAQARWSADPISQIQSLEPLYVRPPDIRLPRSRQ